MPLNKVLKLALDDSVVGPTIENFTDPVTTGKTGIVQIFGAALPGQGLVSLHWGSSSSGWLLIRAVAQSTYEFSNINEDFLGDGLKMFRVTRSKAGAIGTLAIVTWFKAVEN